MILIRTTFWLGAVVDVLAGLQLLLPRSIRFLGFEGLRDRGSAGLPAVTGAALMLGFTAVLVWAQAHPIKRRGILVITLGVILALAAVNVAAGLTGTQSWDRLAGPLVIQGVLATLFALSWGTARAAVEHIPAG